MSQCTPRPMVLKWSSDGGQWSYPAPQSTQCCPNPKNYPVPEWPKDQLRPIESLPPLQETPKDYNKPIRGYSIPYGWLRSI
jgi:hypothetical protein